MPDAVMLFAAGFGTRMGAMTAQRPKPLIDVAGKSLLDHALDQAKGLSTKVVNTHYLGAQIAAHLAGRDVKISHETPQILDTGGGLKAALPLLGPEPVFTLNTDAVWAGPNPLPLLAKAWQPDVMDALVLCVPLNRAVGRKGGGDFTVTPSGEIRWTGDMVYTGAQIVKTDVLHQIEDEVFSMHRLWNAALDKGRFHGTPYPGAWCDVGHPEGIALAEDLLARADV